MTQVSFIGENSIARKDVPVLLIFLVSFPVSQLHPFVVWYLPLLSTMLTENSLLFLIHLCPFLGLYSISTLYFHCLLLYPFLKICTPSCHLLPSPPHQASAQIHSIPLPASLLTLFLCLFLFNLLE